MIGPSSTPISIDPASARHRCRSTFEPTPDRHADRPLPPIDVAPVRPCHFRCSSPASSSEDRPESCEAGAGNRVSNLGAGAGPNPGPVWSLESQMLYRCCTWFSGGLPRSFSTASRSRGHRRLHFGPICRVGPRRRLKPTSGAEAGGSLDLDPICRRRGRFFVGKPDMSKFWSRGAPGSRPRFASLSEVRFSEVLPASPGAPPFCSLRGHL